MLSGGKAGGARRWPRCRLSSGVCVAFLVGVALAGSRVVEGASPAASRKQAGEVYGELLGRSLGFFEGQRLGDLPDAGALPWRTTAQALKDGADSNADLSGGFADGGTYLKCTFPLAFSTTFLAWSGWEFWDGYASAGYADRILAIVKWSTDYLLRANVEGKLFVQVGDLATEQANWGPDTAIPVPRPSFAIPEADGTDVAMETVAALAASSHLFNLHATVAIPATYSQQLLTRALALYTAAFNNPTRNLYQTLAPAAAGTYPSGEWDDEMVWATTWLLTALRGRNTPEGVFDGNATAPYPVEQLTPALLAARLASFFTFTPWLQKPSYAAPSYSSKVPLTYALLHRVNLTFFAEEWASPLYQTDARLRAGFFTPGGLAWWAGASERGSAGVSAAAAAVSFFTTKSMRDKGRSGAEAVESVGIFQLGYLLGGNPKGTTYITSLNPTSPLRASHRPSSGMSSLSCINSTSPNTYQLPGALVAGPDKNDDWTDERAAWGGGNQPTLAAQAAWTASLAYILTQPATSMNVPIVPLMTNTTQLYPDPCTVGTAGVKDTGGGSKTVAAAVGSTVAILVLATVVGVFLYRRHKNLSRPTPSETSSVFGSHAGGATYFPADPARGYDLPGEMEPTPSDGGTLVEDGRLHPLQPVLLDPSEGGLPAAPANAQLAELAGSPLRRPSAREAREAYLESLRTPTWTGAYTAPARAPSFNLGGGGSRTRSQRRSARSRRTEAVLDETPEESTEDLSTVGGVEVVQVVPQADSSEDLVGAAGGANEGGEGTEVPMGGVESDVGRNGGRTGEGGTDAL